MSMKKISGAVVIHDNPDLDAVVSLLSLRMSDRLKYRRCIHAYELNVNEHFDFILIGNFEALERTIHLYQSRGRKPPLILHVAHPDQLRPHYNDLFPGVRIIPIAQADLDEMDETLHFLIFETIMQQLAAG